MSTILIALALLGFLDLCALAALVALYLLTADLTHSIEDLRHFAILNRSDPSIDASTMARFLNPTPVQSGDIKFHIPDFMKAQRDD